MNWYKHAKIWWTKKDLETIKNLLEKGYSYTKIAKLFDVNRHAIMHLNKKYKWIEPPPRAMTEDNLQTIQELFDEGNSFEEIAETIGIGVQYLYRQNKKYQWRNLEEDKIRKDKWLASLYLLPIDGGRGMSYGEIRRDYGVDGKRIQLALEALGLGDKWRSRGNEYSSEQQSRKKNEDLIEQYQEYGTPNSADLINSEDMEL